MLGLRQSHKMPRPLYGMWADINWRVASNVRTMHELNKMVSNDGVPVLLKPSEAPSDWPTIRSPLFSKLNAVKSGNKTVLFEGDVAVHPDIAPVIKKLTQNPFDNNFIRSVEAVNRWGKKMSLSFSLFHYLSLLESASATLMRGKNPMRGMMVIGEKNPVSGKREAVRTPWGIGTEIMSQPDFLKDSIGHGLTLGSVSDAQVGATARDLMSLEAIAHGRFGKFVANKARRFNDAWDTALWDNFHAPLKAFTYNELVIEGMKKYPDMDIDLLKEQVASHVNDAYGGQEWASKMWATPQIQQMMRIGMLAPDYTLSNLRVAGKTINRNSSPLEKKLGARYWRNMLPTLTIGPAIAQYAIYKAFGDEDKGDDPYMWNNEIGKKFDIDVTPIMRKFSSDSEDSKRMYAHLGKQAREIGGWLQDPIQTIYGKSSPVVQIATEQAFGINGPSRFETEASQINFWERFPENTGAEIIARGKDTAEKFVPFAWRGNNFAMTTPMSGGISEYQTIGGFERVLDLYANPSSFRFKDSPDYINSLEQIAPDIADAARRNGIDVEKYFNIALNRKRTYYYGKLFESLEDENATEDHVRYAKAIIRLHGGAESIYRSAVNRGIDFQEESDALQSFLNAYKIASEEVDTENFEY